ncbi:MAG: putative transporter permease protein [Sporomusa sp.]|jgi:iron complex transport system permease protein|nr:putative transporter permease protein [Sporomusa sp.]
MAKVTEQSAESIKLSILIMVLAAIFFLSFLVGRYPIAPDIALGILLSKIIHLTPFWTEDLEIVMLKIRLPRIMAAILVGAALSAAGAAYQGMFRNPMVSPGILGVTAGASFGAALAILLSLDAVGIQLAAFAFGLLAVTTTYLITLWLGKKGETILVMILAGIIIGTLFTSFVSLIKYVADPNDALPAITYWLMGSLASVNDRDVYLAAVPIVAGLFVLTLLRWNLNVMSFGDEEAKALGVNTVRLRIIVVVCATMVTASAVAISGVIGLVGLVVPHLSRLLVGPNYKILLPVSIVMGSIFMLLVDDLARTMFSVEVPLGILTSIIGAPFFLYLLLHTRKGWA